MRYIENISVTPNKVIKVATCSMPRAVLLNLIVKV